MKYKTEWDLTHIYKGDYKKAVKKDLQDLKRIYTAFANKYRKDKKHLKNPKALAKAIEEMEKLSSHPASERGYAFYMYRECLNSQDNEAQAELAKLSDFYAELSNLVVFFGLEIGKIDKKLQDKFLKSKELAPFKYFLQNLFDNARHHLTEAEEKIITLKSQPAHGMWESGFSRLLNKQTVSFEGKDLPLAEAQAKWKNLPTKERRELYGKINKVFESVSDFAESEINAIYTDKKIEDKLRGFKTAYEATVKGYENEMKTIKELLNAVNSKNSIAQRFYKIKAEMLGEKTLKYADRAAKVGEVEAKITFEQAVEKTVKAFSSADPEFGKFAEEMFVNGNVDVYPKVGKSGGAFCSTPNALPSYILLNHNDDFHSLTTLAHEMGHAIHAKLSRRQRPLYENHTMSVAEVASTFFENLVFEDALQNISEKDKIILLHDKITDDINTIFRQIACFNFENELHETVRKEGFVPKEKIAELMNKHMQAYLGPVFDLDLQDGYFFVNWSHIRRFFYVYSYAFGQLISDALYARYKADKSKIKDVIEFLSAGGSDTPENIFRKIGINPNKKLFETGLLRIEKSIDELERLWSAQKKAKKAE